MPEDTKEWMGLTGEQSCGSAHRERQKSEDELVELNKEIPYNKGCVQNMVQMLLSFDDPDVSSPAQAALNPFRPTQNYYSAEDYFHILDL
jgi:hypothetical protein